MRGSGRGEEGWRMLIVDDHATTRLGIRQILAEAFPAAVFGEAGDATRALRWLGEDVWELVVLDISLPGRDGMDLLGEIRGRWPGVRVLVYSAHPEDQFARRALALGADAYLAKERAPEELESAVRRILGDDRPVAGAGKRWPHERLSAREFEVLRCVAEGLGGKEIANRLGLSPKTVSTYRVRSMKKLGLGSTAAVVEYALRHRLLPAGSVGKV